MRRFSAIMLLCLMVLPVLVPLTALGQDEDAKLPMCCRRHMGKRCHCTMRMAYLASRLPGTKWIVTPVPCPDCPSTAPASVHFQLGLNFASPQFAPINTDPAFHAHTKVRARNVPDRAWRKRGPPASLLA